MLLFVDETENENYFIVTGLLVESSSKVDLAYKQFKKKIDGLHISPKEKRTIYTEFKSTILDKHYQKIKIRLLEEINAFENSVIYSCYIKKSEIIRQNEKEDAYVLLLSKIALELQEQTNIIFDTFNKPDFEARIISTLSPFSKVSSVESRDSRSEAGLQFADNLCSVMRLHKSDRDVNNFYEIIKSHVKEI